MSRAILAARCLATWAGCFVAATAVSAAARATRSCAVDAGAESTLARFAAIVLDEHVQRLTETGVESLVDAICLLTET